MNKFEVKEVRRSILLLAIPAILEMMLHTLVWTADTAMIGRLGPASISAVNLGAQIVFTLGNILGGIGIGAVALVCRNIGADNKIKAENIATQSIGIGVLVSLIIGILGMSTSGLIFKKLVDDTEVITLGTEYLRILFVGGIFLIPLLITNSVIRGSGNAIVPLISALVANVVNIVFDYLLIFGKFGFPEMGVKGAAIATAGAQLIGFLVTLIFLLRGKLNISIRLRNIFKFNKEDIKNIVRLSIPATMEVGMNDGSRLLSIFWIAQMGTLTFSGHSLATAAESISYMPGFGFALATTALVGQSLGAKNPEKAEFIVKKTRKYAVLMMGSIGLMFFIIPYPLMRLYSNDYESVSIAARCLRIGAFEQIPIAIAMVYSGALKGAGDTKGPFKIALTTNIIVRLPLIFAIVFLIKGQIEYVWIATVLQYTVEAVLMKVRYGKGNWKSIVL